MLGPTSLACFPCSKGATVGNSVTGVSAGSTGMVPTTKGVEIAESFNSERLHTLIKNGGGGFSSWMTAGAAIGSSLGSRQLVWLAPDPARGVM